MQLFICYLAIFAAFFATSTNGQGSNSRVKPGGCPSIPPMGEFDKAKFTGRWYEVERSPSIFDFIMKCLAVDYLTLDNDPNMDVIVRGNAVGGLPITIKGDGMQPAPGNSNPPGKYTVRFGFGVPFQGTEMTILDTDYNEYALIYACTNSILPKLFHTQFLWVMSRNKSLSNPTRQNIYELLDGYKINRVGLTLSDRSACPKNATTTLRESDQNLAAPEPEQIELEPIKTEEKAAEPEEVKPTIAEETVAATPALD